MSNLICLSEPRSAAAEAYRGLRTQLSFALGERAGDAADQARRILISSPSVDADRAELAANLAVVCAQAGQSVALVDADLRKPFIHQYFDLDSQSGLSSYLSGEADQPDRMLQATSVEGLKVLSSGPVASNPAEQLGGLRMRTLLDSLSKEHDWLIVSAPPIVPVTDATILAPLVDGVVLGVAAGRSRRDHTERASEILESVNANLMGVVLTGVENSAAYGAYGS